MKFLFQIFTLHTYVLHKATKIWRVCGTTVSFKKYFSNNNIFTGRNEVVAKVMFLQVCVILFTGGVCIPACIAGGIPTCLAAGLQGGCALSGGWLVRGCLVWGACSGGGGASGLVAFWFKVAFWFGGLLVWCLLVESGLLI